MTEREEWHMGMMHIFADFVINGGGTYQDPIIELVKWSVRRMEEDNDHSTEDMGI
jgi:hypothetical protein